jgi:hypothetical protein
MSKPTFRPSLAALALLLLMLIAYQSEEASRTDSACRHCQIVQAPPPRHLADNPEPEQQAVIFADDPAAITGGGRTIFGEAKFSGEGNFTAVGLVSHQGFLRG